jgi:hypothetical protein
MCLYQEPPSEDGSPVPEADTVQPADLEHEGAEEEAGVGAPAADDEDDAAPAGEATAAGDHSPSRAASITLGQMARESERPPLSVSMMDRTHSVPVQQVTLPPSVRNLAPLRTSSSVCSSGTFSRRGFRRD